MQIQPLIWYHFSYLQHTTIIDASDIWNLTRKIQSTKTQFNFGKRIKDSELNFKFQYSTSQVSMQFLMVNNFSWLCYVEDISIYIITGNQRYTIYVWNSLLEINTLQT